MKISVITVSCNSAKTIEDTIQSVLSQNYPDTEYIIIDGGSTDGTVDIIKKYEDRLAYWVSEPDKGISDAFNKGIRQATGELICIINSDDTLLPNVLNIIAEQICENTDIIYGNMSIYRKSQGLEKIHYTQDNLNFSKGRFYGLLHPSALIKKNTYDKYGLYDISLKYVMDKELFLRMYNGGAKFQRINLTIARYSTGGASGAQNYCKVAIESRKVSIKYGMSNVIATYIMIKNMLQIKLVEMVQRIKYFNKSTYLI
jgi:glycosyltransferase involved in cell wall biosynthesis